VCEADYAFDELLSRVRGEYLEMPGLHLSVSQATRLWGLHPVVTEALLSCLVASRFLRRTGAGTFALATSEGRAVPVPGRARAAGESRLPFVIGAPGQVS
jgi:hypothetical protein